MAKQILTLNQISLKGLERLPRDSYEIASEFSHPDAILVRSHKLQPEHIPDSVLAIARAEVAEGVRALAVPGSQRVQRQLAGGQPGGHRSPPCG